MASIEQTAEFLGVTPATVRKYIAEGLMRPGADPEDALVRIGPKPLPSGRPPGTSAVTLTEHRLRDDLARQLRGTTEAGLKYGRADVATRTHIIEVEPLRSWRHGARQALAYSAQCTLAPGLALFGRATRDQVLAVYLTVRADPKIDLWWWSGIWQQVSNRNCCRAMLSDPDDSQE